MIHSLIEPRAPLAEEPSADLRETAPVDVELTREAYESLLEDNRRLLAELKAAKRERGPSAFSPADIARMLRDGEDGFNESDYRDSFEELVEGSYRIDHRAEGEGFGKGLDPKLIVVCKIPQSFKFTAQCAVVSSRRAECQEREFEATRLETDDPDYVFYSVRLIGG